MITNPLNYINTRANLSSLLTEHYAYVLAVMKLVSNPECRRQPLATSVLGKPRGLIAQVIFCQIPQPVILHETYGPGPVKHCTTDASECAQKLKHRWYLDTFKSLLSLIPNAIREREFARDQTIANKATRTRQYFVAKEQKIQRNMRACTIERERNRKRKK